MHSSSTSLKLLAICWLLLASLVHADQRQDSFQVEADVIQMQEGQKQASPYFALSGNVEIESSSYSLSSETAEIQADSGTIVDIKATGSPLVFIIENAEQDIKATSQRLHYSAATSKLILEGRVVVVDNLSKSQFQTKRLEYLVYQNQQGDLAIDFFGDKASSEDK